MFGNCDKTTDEIIDDQMASSTGSRVMEKPGQELLQQQQQQQQQALRCPRCDSSNTKFCYYNNYSLSQPRHFCKACKRYWTRGGTLRNVPVGGGCRKNKRVKRQSSNSNNIDTTNASSPSSSTPNPPSQPHMDIMNPSSSTTSASNHVNPLQLYGLNNSCHDVMNLPFPTRFVNSRVSTTTSGYDLLQPQLNALGLGCFSSGILASDHQVNDDGYRNGFSSNDNTLLSSYNSIFGGGNTNSTSMPSTPVMASLLSSTLLQQKFINGGGGGGMKGDPFPFHGMAPLQNSSEAEGMVASKEVKGEGQNRLLMEWNNNNNGAASACQNQMEHMGLLTDPSLYWNNNSNNTSAAATALGGGGGGGGTWSDHQPNIGPNSVTSLI